jgi:hypothetical protein
MQDKMMAAERKAEEDSIEKILAFQKHQKHKYREIEKLREADREVKYEMEQDALIKRLEILQDELMEIEIKLQSALKDAIAEFNKKEQKAKEGFEIVTQKFSEAVEEELKANFYNKI